MAAPAWVSGSAQSSSQSTKRQTTVVAVGDSITANGLTAQNDLANGLIGKLDGKNWLMWASLLSGGKLVYAGALGTGGYTSAQVLANHVPVAIATAADMVVLQMGTNDIGSLSLAQTRANMLAACQQIQAAGKVPVLCTLTPRNDILGTQSITQINLAYQRLALENGWPLVDWYTALLDTSTGGWQSGDNSDNVHPTVQGAKKMGQKFADVMPGGSGSGGAPYQHITSTPGLSLVTNPLMVDTNSDGIPDDYSTPSGSATNACANGSAGEIGKVWTVTRSAADSSWNHSIGMAVTAGHRILVTCKLGSVAKAPGGSIAVRLCTNDSVTHAFSLEQNWTEDIPAGSLLNVITRVPAGVTTLTWRGSVMGAANTKLSTSQVFITDLDANGL